MTKDLNGADGHWSLVTTNALILAIPDEYSGLLMGGYREAGWVVAHCHEVAVGGGMMRVGDDGDSGFLLLSHPRR